MNSTSANCGAVTIAVRERPARANLEKKFKSSIVTYHPSGNNIIVNNAVFTFDHVLGPNVTQKEIFESVIKPLVGKVKQGFNCTALAYGQTGTGKSFTMGLDSENFDGDNAGVIPRCLREMFLKTEENSENQETLSKHVDIKASFIEIYNEKVYDLLGNNTNEPIVAKGYKYTGGIRKHLMSLDECYAVLKQGNKNRHVRPTKMNSQSSRSHAIFTIHVCTRVKNANVDETVTVACMNIVDLAGSEGVRRTGHQGMAMSEGVHINQGLLSIGKVLQAMTTGSKVIPYRDSVLSSVLQDSLNSNSYLTLIACISPHSEDMSESLSTLRFAQNAKQLKNTPEINNILADIKKNIKLKPTPYKLNGGIQVNNDKTVVLKRTYNNVCNSQIKKSIKSNTFCTPKRQRLVQNKCNQTEIASNYKRPKLSNTAMNMSKIAQLEHVNDRESLFNRTNDSNDSLLSSNMSTSTALDGHAKQRNANPVVRKCIADFKNELEDNLVKMLQENLHTLISQTPAPVPNNNSLPSVIRQELKTIMKEVLFEENLLNNDACNRKGNDLSNASINTNARYQLFNSSIELFKIPGTRPIANKHKTSSPIKNIKDYATISSSFTQTFFADASFPDKAVLNKSIRRSIRITEKQQHDQSQYGDNISLTNDIHLMPKRSCKSVLQIPQRRSIRLAANLVTPIKTVKVSATAKKINKVLKTDKLSDEKIDVTNKRKSLTVHRKDVLDLLNKGSMKDIQILPQIGPKTAYQIITQRTLKGKFKSFAQIEKLPIWRGNGWERFAQANMLI
ncbi:hypothetical protein DOY81_000922 [Sarcophaga bullata]|nr:hypothetical protein DOY81_000922 [Sarcophaga bullata]